MKYPIAIIAAVVLSACGAIAPDSSADRGDGLRGVLR
jgi:hypothetical protein